MILYFKSIRRKCDAICDYTNGQFVVKKGSIIAPNIQKFKMSKEALFARNDKKIVDKNNMVIQDISFKSSSTAGQFVAGSSVNGRKCWKDANGITLRELIKETI